VTNPYQASVQSESRLLLSSKDIPKFAEEDLTPYFADVEDHIEKIFEELEESKEIVDIYEDTDFMLSTEKSNKILAILTIIFTLSIPTSTITFLWNEY